MIYLDVRNRKEDIVNEDLQVVNEDFVTFLHNFWTRYLINGSHAFNLKKFNPFELFATLCYIPYTFQRLIFGSTLRNTMIKRTTNGSLSQSRSLNRKNRVLSQALFFFCLETLI